MEKVRKMGKPVKKIVHLEIFKTNKFFFIFSFAFWSPVPHLQMFLGNDQMLYLSSDVYVKKFQCPHNFLLNINSPGRHPCFPDLHPTHTPLKGQALYPIYLMHRATCTPVMPCTMDPSWNFCHTLV